MRREQAQSQRNAAVALSAAAVGRARLASACYALSKSTVCPLTQTAFHIRQGHVYMYSHDHVVHLPAFADFLADLPVRTRIAIYAGNFEVRVSDVDRHRWRPLRVEQWSLYLFDALYELVAIASVRSGNRPVATEVAIRLCPSEDTDHWKFTLLRAHFGGEMPEHLYDLLRPSGGPEAETKIYRLRSRAIVRQPSMKRLCDRAKVCNIDLGTVDAVTLRSASDYARFAFALLWPWRRGRNDFVHQDYHDLPDDANNLAECPFLLYRRFEREGLIPGVARLFLDHAQEYHIGKVECERRRAERQAEEVTAGQPQQRRARADPNDPFFDLPEDFVPLDDEELNRIARRRLAGVDLDALPFVFNRPGEVAVITSVPIADVRRWSEAQNLSQ